MSGRQTDVEWAGLEESGLLEQSSRNSKSGDPLHHVRIWRGQARGAKWWRSLSTLSGLGALVLSVLADCWWWDLQGQKRCSQLEPFTGEASVPLRRNRNQGACHNFECSDRWLHAPSDSLVRTLLRPTLSHPLSSSGTGTDRLSSSRVSVVDSSRQNLPARNPTARHHAEIFMPIPRSWCSRRGAGGIVSGLP